MLRRYRLLIVVALVSSSLVGLSPIAPAGGGGFCSGGKFTDAATTDIAMSEMCFSPTVSRIQPGDTVTFHNKDKTLHMVGGVNNVFGDLHTEVEIGKSVSYRFDEEGVYPYVCILHPGMGGAIVVGDGKGKATAAAAVTVEPPAAEVEAAAPVSERVEGEKTGADGSPAWVVPVAIAFGIAVLSLAAIPMKRRAGSGAIATKL